MAQHVIYPWKCSKCTWEDCVFCSYWMECFVYVCHVPLVYSVVPVYCFHVGCSIHYWKCDIELSHCYCTAVYFSLQVCHVSYIYLVALIMSAYIVVETSSQGLRLVVEIHIPVAVNPYPFSLFLAASRRSTCVKPSGFWVTRGRNGLLKHCPKSWGSQCSCDSFLYGRNSSPWCLSQYHGGQSGGGMSLVRWHSPYSFHVTVLRFCAPPTYWSFSNGLWSSHTSIFVHE